MTSYPDSYYFEENKVTTFFFKTILTFDFKFEV